MRRIWPLPLGVTLLLLLGLAVDSCRGAASTRRSFLILAVNDIYRIAGVDDGTQGGLARLRTLRSELEAKDPDLLLLHAGDALFPSLLSRLFLGAQMIDVLNLLDGDAQAFDSRMFMTFGNHEFDRDKSRDAALVQDRIEESQFSWLGTNLVFAQGGDGRPVVAASNLLGSRIVEAGGVKVGLFSVTTDAKHPEYVESFGDPLSVARSASADLRRQGAEVVVALTHLRMAEDVELVKRLGAEGPDLILGGHEHNRQSAEVGGRWVIKADAEARSASLVRVTVSGSGMPDVKLEYRQLGAAAATDPAVQASIESWISRHDEEYCAAELQEPAGCLSRPLGRTQVRLLGEELEMRRFETNLGNWILDQARAALAERGASLAFLNSGSLRLNQDLPAASEITLRHVEEIFQYPTELRLLRITGQTLQEAVSHSVTDWTGNGKWLQISGFAFRHDPTAQSADQLTLLGPDGPRPILADEELLVVTGDFLADPRTGQDGYTMFTESMVVQEDGDPITLRSLVIDRLEAAAEEGIAPQVEGRICNPQRPGPCLAQAQGTRPE